MANDRLKIAVALLSTALSGWSTYVAAAQPAPSPDRPIAGANASPDGPANDTADIIVTANRREERAQKVGVSITAVSGATLVERNLQTAEDLVKLVPGLNATSASGTGVTTIVIRGVGETDFSDHQEQPNATYQDGVYVPFSTAIGVPLFDLQRVEALRGPQGTLFGRNATGGLLQYVSNKPVAGTSGAAELAAGDRSLLRGQGYLNVGNDKISGRLAFYYQHQSGFILNRLGRARGDKEVYALRGEISFKPTPQTKILLRVDGFNQYGTAPGYKSTPSYAVNGVSTDLPANVDAYGTGPGNDAYGYRNPYSGLKVSLNDPGLLNKEARTYAATIEQSLGNATLTSTSSYATAYTIYREDTDSTPVAEFGAGLHSRADNFQQEIRVNGSVDRFRYTAGAFYLNISGNYAQYNDFPTTPVFFGIGQAGSRADNFYHLNTQSEAIFGQGEYDIGSKLTAILGARYTWDQLDYNFRLTCSQTGPGACALLFAAPTDIIGATVSALGPIALSDRRGDWSGRAQLNYKPMDNLLLYASASKGLKSSGYTAALAGNFPVDAFNYKPEKLYEFELGEKAQLVNHKLTLNGSVYYYDYHDLQTFLFSGLVTSVLNRNATAYGGELELSARPGDGFTAHASIAYNHFLIHGIATANAPNGEDQRPVNAPRIQLNFGIGKSFDLGSDYKIQLDYNGRYISSVDYNIVNTLIVKATPYTVHDFAVRLETPRKWTFSAYLNNAFDKTYQVGAFDVTFLAFVLRQYGEPRTFSLSAGYKF